MPEGLTGATSEGTPSHTCRLKASVPHCTNVSEACPWQGTGCPRGK